MNCQDVQNLIHAYLDGELDVVKSLEIEQHLQDCPTCSHAYRNHQALRTAIGDNALYYRAPASLQKRVQSAVRQSSHAGSTLRSMPWRWLGVLASLVVIIAVTWGVTRLSSPAATEVLAQEVVASHVRSLMPDHLEDVASSDEHTVKPWFSGKLDFSPPVVDLANQGFPLMGGRLDYLDNRPVAALVYHHQQHVINVFIWPSTGGSDVAAKTETRQGYHLAYWTKFGMMYWAISDVNETELQQFVQLIQAQATP